MNFDDLKRNKGLTGAQQLQEELAKMQPKSPPDYKDENEKFWQLKKDKSGLGAAIIRFLPAPDGESVPWVRLFTHAFQGPGGWYIEKSLTTINKPDPLGEYNRELWNSGIESNKQIARKQKRRLTYISNIIVLKDPAEPENEGKVFLFKYGKKIFEKIQQVMAPEEDPLSLEDGGVEKQPMNPFCPWEGANFRMKSKIVEGYPNYDLSEFSPPTPLAGGDDTKIKEIWAQEHGLQELIADDQFKTYEQLRERLQRVLGSAINPTTNESSTSSGETTNVTQTVSAPAQNLNVEELEDDLKYLQQLASEEI